jgi:hypothetical protein
MTLFTYTLSLIRLSFLSLVIKQEILGRTYSATSWLMLSSNIQDNHTYDLKLYNLVTIQWANSG